MTEPERHTYYLEVNEQPVCLLIAARVENIAAFFHVPHPSQLSDNDLPAFARWRDEALLPHMMDWLEDDHIEAYVAYASMTGEEDMT